MTDAVIESMLGQLRLSACRQNYAVLAKEAIKNNKSHLEYLKALLAEEINQRLDRRVKTIITKAKFPILKTLADFDFSLVPTLNKHKILELTEGDFIDNQQNVCFLGQTGTGKTHLATAIAYEACKRKYPVLFFSAAKLVNELLVASKNLAILKLQKKLAKAKLIVIDELGYIPFSKEGAELIFQFFAEAYEKQSLIITSNLEFSEWTNFLGDPTMTSALLDRFTHHCQILTINAESYRFRQRKNKQPG